MPTLIAASFALLRPHFSSPCFFLTGLQHFDLRPPGWTRRLKSFHCTVHRLCMFSFLLLLFLYQRIKNRKHLLFCPLHDHLSIASHIYWYKPLLIYLMHCFNVEDRQDKISLSKFGAKSVSKKKYVETLSYTLVWLLYIVYLVLTLEHLQADYSMESKSNLREMLASEKITYTIPTFNQLTYFPRRLSSRCTVVPANSLQRVLKERPFLLSWMHMKGSERRQCAWAPCDFLLFELKLTLLIPSFPTLP